MKVGCSDVTKIRKRERRIGNRKRESGNELVRGIRHKISKWWTRRESEPRKKQIIPLTSGNKI